MDSDDEAALTAIITITFTENIKRKKKKRRERNGLNLGFNWDDTSRDILLPNILLSVLNFFFILLFLLH